MDNFSLGACDLRLLRIRLKKNRATRRSEMRTIPPIMPPMIAPVGFLLGVVVLVEEATGGELAVLKFFG